MIRKVLLVDDDRAVREALSQTFMLADLQPIPTGSYMALRFWTLCGEWMPICR